MSPTSTSNKVETSKLPTIAIQSKQYLSHPSKELIRSNLPIPSFSTTPGWFKVSAGLPTDESNPGKREESRDSFQYPLGVYRLPEGY
jgi:hypothetical protein